MHKAHNLVVSRMCGICAPSEGAESRTTKIRTISEYCGAGPLPSHAARRLLDSLSVRTHIDTAHSTSRSVRRLAARGAEYFTLRESALTVTRLAAEHFTLRECTLSACDPARSTSRSVRTGHERSSRGCTSRTVRTPRRGRRTATPPPGVIPTRCPPPGEVGPTPLGPKHFPH